MPGRVSTLNGIEVPPDFPIDLHERIGVRVTSILTQESPHFSRFIGAWSALLYRFLACCDHDDAFRGSLKRAGSTPQQPERYIQERELFNFFVNSLSAFECLCYALFTIGALIRPDKFEFRPVKGGQPQDGKERSIHPKNVAESFQAAYPNDPLSGFLAATIASDEYIELCKTRNLLAHRVAPGRLIFLSNRQNRDSFWKVVDIPITAELTRSRRAWLATVISDILDKTDTFTATRL